MSNFKKFCFFQKKIYCSKNARIPLNLGGAEFLQKFTVYVFANQILLLRFFCGYNTNITWRSNDFWALILLFWMTRRSFLSWKRPNFDETLRVKVILPYMRKQMHRVGLCDFGGAPRGPLWFWTFLLDLHALPTEPISMFATGFVPTEPIPMSKLTFS